MKAVSGTRSKFLEKTAVMLLRGLSEGSPEEELERRQVHRPVNRSAREPLSPGAGGEGVQQTRFFFVSNVFPGTARHDSGSGIDRTAKNRDGETVGD